MRPHRHAAEHPHRRIFYGDGLCPHPLGLRAMGTTEEALPGAILYLRVYFLGMVPNVIYNMGTGVLRAIGDFGGPSTSSWPHPCATLCWICCWW